MNSKTVIFDDSWIGLHGIGRFAKEIMVRFRRNVHSDTNGMDVIVNACSCPKLIHLGLQGHPLSILNILKRPLKLMEHKIKHKNCVFFTPGFNPPCYSPMPFVFTLHDLTQINLPAVSTLNKRLYYDLVVKPAAKKAFKILTDSDFSKMDILKWLKLPEEQVVVVGCGVSDNFSSVGDVPNFDYPYIFCLGNVKPHKNLIRIINAFAHAKIDKVYKLVVAGAPRSELLSLIKQWNIMDRVKFEGVVPENLLPFYYRGATAFLFPSLYEGFGLPIIEAMACGTPVITSNVTSMPEVAGNAAWLVDPYDVDAITNGIERLVSDQVLRSEYVRKGLTRAAMFTWDKTAGLVHSVLNEACGVTT